MFIIIFSIRKSIQFFIKYTSHWSS